MNYLKKSKILRPVQTNIKPVWTGFSCGPDRFLIIFGPFLDRLRPVWDRSRTLFLILTLNKASTDMTFILKNKDQRCLFERVHLELMTGVTGNRLCPSAGQAGYISCCFVKEDTELIGSTKLGFIFYINFQDSSCRHKIS